MIIRRTQMSKEVRENMRGDSGCVEITHIVAKEELPHGRLLADLVIPPGGSIGEHTHEKETEYYLIHAGRGVVVDDGEEKEIGPGDVVVTGDGASHSIRTSSDVPLRMTALIITHDAPSATRLSH